jgi:hypothetical protein
VPSCREQENPLSKDSLFDHLAGAAKERKRDWRALVGILWGGHRRADFAMTHKAALHHRQYGKLVASV